MKKLSRDEMKQVKGGETPDNCITQEYCLNYCLTAGYDGGFCKINSGPGPYVCKCLFNIG